jgi:peptide chain release factor 1
MAEHLCGVGSAPTDHRIGLTLHQLDQVMEGHLDPIINALTAYYQTEKLLSW